MFLLNKHMLNGRRAITRNENKTQFKMANEVLRHKNNRLKKILCIHAVILNRIY